MASMSSARQCEIIGMKWSNIDWENSQVYIQRTYNNRQWYNPKSRSSNRRVDIGPMLINTLKKWRLACPANEEDLIFPNDEGQPIVHTLLLRKHFWPTLKKAGIPHIRFHDLCHTYASLQIERGLNIKYIQSQLGHAEPTVTLKVYAHLMSSVNKEAAVGLEDMVFKRNAADI